MADDALRPLRRTWQITLFGAHADRVIARLEAAGYAQREAPGPGQFSDWRDVEPHHGATSSALYVVEDPSRPILDRLVADVGGTITTKP